MSFLSSPRRPRLLASRSSRLLARPVAWVYRAWPWACQRRRPLKPVAALHRRIRRCRSCKRASASRLRTKTAW